MDDVAGMFNLAHELIRQAKGDEGHLDEAENCLDGIEAAFTALTRQLANYPDPDMYQAVSEDYARVLDQLSEAQQHAETLAEALSEASEELEYFVDFARRQCEFEGDDEAGMAVVRNARAALAAYRSVK